MLSGRTREEVKDAFTAHGVTVVEWARAHGFSADSVYAVLLGRTRGTRGESHRIAVALGLKSPVGTPNPMIWPDDGRSETAKAQQEKHMPGN